MTSPARMKNIGGYLAPAAGGAFQVVAGGGLDGVEQTGQIIDLQALGNPASCIVLLTYATTLTASETLTLGFDVDHGDDSGLSDAAQFNAGVAAAVLQTGVGTFHGYLELDLRLDAAKRYLRTQLTATMSHTTTDTATIAVSYVFGGFRELPQ